MGRIALILADLPQEATFRVLDYLNRRYLPSPPVPPL